MKIKVITAISTIDHAGFKKLEKSLIKNNYDYSVIINPEIQWNWGGLPYIYDWCKEQTEYTHFLYTDGFDTIALSDMQEVIEKYKSIDCIIYSGEKACFPITEWATIHTSESKWRYLNHGQFIAPIDLFISLYENVFNLPITCQEWAMEKFLFSNNDKLLIDDKCDIFQSMAFDYEGEIIANGNRIYNTITQTKSVFVHGNGRTNIDWIYDLSANKNIIAGNSTSPVI